MNKEELLKEIEKLKGKIMQLEEKLDKPKFERTKEYHTVDIACGEAVNYCFNDVHCEDDNYNFKNNNYFITEKHAKDVAEKINFLLKLERLHDIYCLNYVPNWNDGKYKWYVFFDKELKSYNFTSDLYWDRKVATYFDSEETAQKVCNILNNELEKNNDLK